MATIFPVCTRLGLRLGMALVAAGALLPAAVPAQSLTVSPVNIDIPASQSTVAITVTNNGDSPSNYQIRSFAWSQDAEGNDVLAPTRDVLISPPLGTIAPAGNQTIRLMLRRRPGTTEASYRIILDQLPGAPTSTGTRMVLRFSIPIFAQPTVRVEPQVKWRVAAGNGEPVLIAQNSGARHAKFWDMAVADAGGAPLKFAGGGPQYILAGATRRWPIEARPGALAAGGRVALSAHSDRGAVKEPLAVSD